MAANEQAWRDREDEKIAAYHATALFLQAHHPGFRVQQLTFVVGALGSLVESEWVKTLEKAELEPKAQRKVMEKAIRAAVEAFDATLSVRQVAKEALGGDGAGISPHPSQRDRPPAHTGGWQP